MAQRAICQTLDKLLATSLLPGDEKPLYIVFCGNNVLPATIQERIEPAVLWLSRNRIKKTGLPDLASQGGHLILRPQHCLAR